MKQTFFRCLKTGITIFIVLSTTLAVYIQWQGRGFDPVTEIQILKSQGHRDDALDILRFLKENQLGDPDQIQKLEEELDYGFLEKVRSLAWNGIFKGEVYDTYSGIGAVSADLTMFGDLRDLVVQTWKRIRGDPDTDNWVMGLSLAGVSSSTFPFVNGS